MKERSRRRERARERMAELGWGGKKQRHWIRAKIKALRASSTECNK